MQRPCHLDQLDKSPQAPGFRASLVRGRAALVHEDGEACARIVLWAVLWQHLATRAKEGPRP